MRKYQELWNRLAKHEVVKLTCSERAVLDIRNGIYNEKYKHQKARKAVDMPGFGRIHIEKEPLKEKRDYVRLTISIKFSGDNL
jgi:hypothetical protein